MSFAQISKDMNVLYTWDNNSSFYNDCWGYVDSYGNEYGIVGTRTHYNFVDVSSNASADLVGSFPGSMSSTWRDMKTYSQWAYGVTEAAEGLSIFFMGDNPGQNGVSFITQNKDYFTAAHNIFIDEQHGRAYVVGTNTQGQGVIILDLKTNPEIPTLLTSTNLQGGYIHDMFVRDHIGYANCGGAGLYIYDFSDPNNIKVLGNLASYPEQGYNHACWLNEDGKHLIMADETRNTGLKVVDVSDPTDIDVLSTFRSALLGPSDVRSIAHNPFIRDNYVIISYYHDGVQVFDMSNPNDVKQVAWYDTEPDNTNYSGWDGVWGAYPYLPSGKILGTDGQTGLYVLKATDITFTPIPPVTQPTASLNYANSICIDQGSSITLTVDTDADVIQWFKGFNQVGFSKDLTVAQEGDYTVKVYKGPHSKTLTVSVGFGTPPDASLNFAGPISLCEGGTHLIEVPAGQNNTYTWLVNGFIQQNQNQNTFLADNIGVYQVIVSNGSCEAYSDEFLIPFIIDAPDLSLNYTETQVICSGGEVTLEVPEGADAYQWFLDDMPIAGATAASYTATEIGNYYVEGKLDACTINSESIFIQVVINPTANLNFLGSQTICEGESLNLSVDFGGDNYDWYLNGELIQSGISNTLIAEQTGEYYVIASNLDCHTESELFNLTVTNNPTVAIDQAEYNQICEGDSFTFTTTGSAESYVWFYNSDVLANENGSSITVNQSGTYEVFASNGDCNSSTPISNLSVLEIPTLTYTGQYNYEICEGDELSLEMTSSIGQRQWFKDGEPYDLNENPILVNTAGAYHFVGSNEFCTSSSELITVSIRGAIDVSFEVGTSNIEICEGESYQLSSATIGTNYLWYQDGVLLNENTSSLNITTPGNYYLEVLDGNCSGTSETIDVSYSQNPEVDLFSPSGFSLCEGEAFIIEASEGYQNYSWYKDGQLLNETGSSITIMDAGNYQVFVSNNLCEGQSNLITISQELRPSIDLQTDSQISFCEGWSQLIEPLVNAESYEWYKDGILIADTYSLDIDEAGTYYLIASNGSCSTTSSNIIATVVQVPSVELNMALGQTICSGEEITLSIPPGAETYEWVLDGEIIGTNNELVVSTAGFYFVRASNGDCVNQTMDISVTVVEDLDLSFNYIGQETICVGESITLEVSAIADQYNWMLDGSPLDESGTSIEISQAGIYSLNTVLGDCETLSESFELLVQEIPSVAFGETESPSLCEGEFYTIMVDEGAENYQWYRNGVLINDESSNVLEVNTNGSYYLLASNESCEVTSQELLIEFTPLPISEIIGNGESICENSGEEITLSSQNVADSYEWILDGEVVGTNQTLMTSITGSYTLLLTNQNCMSFSEAFIISSASGIDANISAISNSICAGETMVLETSPSADAYSWFYNGEQIADSNANTITVSAAGMYSLSLSLNGCQSSSNSFELQVTEYPTANLNLDTDIVLCEGESTIASVAIGAESYTWFYNDEIIDNESAELEISQTGSYYVIAANENCESTSETIQVTVNPIPEANLNVGPQNSICEGELLDIEVSEADAYEWLFNGMSIDNNLPILSASAAGVYQVMISTNGCSSLSEEVNLELVSVPVLSTTNPAFSNYCQGDEIIIEISGEADTYSWIQNNQEISNQTSITVSQSGIYQAIGYNGTCGSEPLEFEVNIFESPNASLNLSGEQVICEGEVLELIANDGYDSYQWYRNSDLLPDTGNQIQVDQAGTYYLIITHNGCEEGSVEMMLTVTELPIPEITSDLLVVCPGERTRLNASISGADSYTWFINGNLIMSSDFPMIDTDLAGSYTVEISIDGCSATSESIEVSIYDVVAPTIEQIENILSSSSAGSYQWFLDGLEIDGATGQGHTALVSGAYYVLVIDENGCESQSEIIDVIISSLANHAIIEGLKIYPNPVVDILTVEYDNLQNNITNLNVFNELGMNISRIENTIQSNKVTVDVNSFPAGIYYLEVILDSGARSTSKFIKTK